MITLTLIVVILIAVAIAMVAQTDEPTKKKKDNTRTEIGEYIIQSETARAYLISCKDWQYRNVWVAKSEINLRNNTISTWLYVRILEGKKQ